ncbi:MAG TPA: SIR2 family protein [Candidatus Paceibacterota bacterium]|nr:SIR2 family protein [Candidatus Paceibacterota bacterium]
MNSNSVQRWLDSIPEAARDESVTRIKQLADLVLSRKVQFLCGAGMSKASGLALASELNARLIQEMLAGTDSSVLVSLSTKYPLEITAEAYLKVGLDQSRLNALIGQELGKGTGKIHDGHRSLEWFASQGFIDRVWTTNFDSLIEDAFAERGMCICDKNVDELKRSRNANKVPVFHLHGTPESEALLTETDTYELVTPLSKLFMADMVTNWLIIVGYSLADTDLRTISLSMREMLKKQRLAKRPYIVLPVSNDASLGKAEWRLAEKIWDAREMLFIPGTAELFLPALREEVRRSRCDNFARVLVKRRGGDPNSPAELEKAWGEARSLAEKSELGTDLDAIEVLAQRHGVNDESS